MDFSYPYSLEVERIHCLLFYSGYGDAIGRDFPSWSGFARGFIVQCQSLSLISYCSNLLIFGTAVDCDDLLA